MASKSSKTKFPFTEEHTRERSPHRRCRQTNRESIEAELVRLRSNRDGFVRSESLRLTSPRHDDSHELRRGGKRWRRPSNSEGRSLVERFRDAARKAKLMELRVVSGRSWWPKRSSEVSDLSPSPPPLPKAVYIESKWKIWSQPKTKVGCLLVDFPRTAEPTQPSRYQRFVKFQQMHQAGIRKSKQKSAMSSNEEVLCKNRELAALEVESSSHEQTLDATIDQTIDDGHKMEEKKKKFPVIATVASLSASGLGVAAAIIFL